MIIQRLKITNIASIESADIDFENGPLGADPVFLITGDTGAGKTTILNSICLALYNEVPSLKSLGAKDTDAEGTMNKDSSQMMRKATTHACVELYFVGNDQQRYIARWSCQRAHRRLSGKVQRPARQLEAVDANIVHTNANVIKNEIKRIVGLDFDQFTRTTMLAQGQFALFMKAKDEDKATILEKLTDTDIYTRIGMKISEQCKATENSYQILEAKIKGACLLSADEVAELQRVCQEKESHIKLLTKDLATIDTQLSWLLRHEALCQQLQAKKEAQSSAAETLNSETLMGYRTAVEQWDATADIRRTLSQHKQSAVTISTLRDRLSTLGRTDWHDILDGICGARQRVDVLRQKAQTLQAEIDRQSPLATIFGNAQRIGEMAKNVASAVNDRDKHKAEYARLKKLSQRSATSEGPLKDAADKAQLNYDAKQAEVNTYQTVMGAYDLPKLSEELSAAHNEVARLQQAITAVQAYINARTALSEAVEAHEKAESALVATKKDYDQSVALIPGAKEAYDKADAYRQGQMELKDHIAMLRQRFAETHECPLCGNPHASLRTDEAIEAKVAEATAAAEAAKKRYDDIVAHANALKAKIDIDTAELTKSAKALDRAKSLVAEALATAESVPPGYAGDEAEASLSILKGAKAKADSHLAQCDGRLAEATAKQRQLNNANLELDALRQALSQAVKKHDQQKQNTQDLTVKAQREAADADAADTQATNILAEIRLCGYSDDPALVSLLRDNTGYDDITIESVGAVSRYLDSGARRYQSDIHSLDKCRRDITDGEQRIARCDEAAASLSPYFGEPYEPMVADVANLESKILTFTTQVSSIDGAIKAEEQKQTQTQALIDEYFADSALSLPQVEQIAATPQQQIDEYRQAVAQALENVKKLATEVEVLSAQLVDLAQSRPYIPDDSTIDSLKAERAEVDAARSDANDQLKYNQARIKQNEENTRLHAENIAQLELLRDELGRWQHLDGVFGNKDGGKFRRIAQSYVLSLLLAKANYYLGMLTHRYTLQCEDGSLTINVIDANQNDTVRNVGLLSGGESFIVSLALALGLSSIGKNDIHIGTLFIDEGFDTLDGSILDTVITMLNSLHTIVGRRIGIISHLQELKYRIPTQIRLESTGPSSARVVVV